MKKWICLLLVLMILRFKEGRMVVNEDAYEFSDIKNFYISETDDPNAIDFLPSGKDVTMAANTVIIPADAVKDVKVYMVDGKEVKVRVEKTDHDIIVHLNELGKGTYVISTGKSSMKVTKK